MLQETLNTKNQLMYQNIVPVLLGCLNQLDLLIQTSLMK